MAGSGSVLLCANAVASEQPSTNRLNSVRLSIIIVEFNQGMTTVFMD
jgi:hypothetical protein